MEEARADEGKLSGDAKDLYRELFANIKTTDDISFKPLGTVPLFSGIGSSVLSLVEKTGQTLNWLTILGLSVVGGLITSGLFRWELRNIQKCKWLISRAAKVEEKLFPGEELSQFRGMASAEDLEATKLVEIRLGSVFDLEWGKTQSEKLIYTAAIAAWCIPLVIGAVSLARIFVDRP